MANSDNPGRGRKFELDVQSWLHSRCLTTRQDFSVYVGAASDRRPHKFDLGCDDPPRLVECKRHTWTKGGNALDRRSGHHEHGGRVALSATGLCSLEAVWR